MDADTSYLDLCVSYPSSSANLRRHTRHEWTRHSSQQRLPRPRREPNHTRQAYRRRYQSSPISCPTSRGTIRWFNQTRNRCRTSRRASSRTCIYCAGAFTTIIRTRLNLRLHSSAQLHNTSPRGEGTRTSSISAGDRSRRTLAQA